MTSDDWGFGRVLNLNREGHVVKDNPSCQDKVTSNATENKRPVLISR